MQVDATDNINQVTSLLTWVLTLVFSVADLRVSHEAAI